MARYNRTSAAGGWLSRLERVLDMHEVTGSSPVPPTTPSDRGAHASRTYPHYTVILTGI